MSKLNSKERELVQLFDSLKNQVKTNVKSEYEDKITEFNKK